MAEAKLLSRDAILAAQDVTYEELAVPEWGGTVRIKALTGEQRDAFESSCVVERKDGSEKFSARDFRAKFVARVIVDEKGTRIFSEEDVQALSRKSAKALDRIFEVGARLAGMTKKDLKALEGNSGAQSDDSTIA